ncbi:MAG: tol-pal system protein YbgF [Pelagibacterales bacterium]|nr:tol-pal system protein YbgF [Pelagibacterales bacterium]
MFKKIIFFCNLLFVLVFTQFNSTFSFGEEYLDTVIKKINKMESDLQKLQEESNNLKSSSSITISNDTIASHEKRLLDLEEEFRVLNGRIDEVLFDLKNISNELLNLKTISRNEKNIYKNSEEEQYVELEKANGQSIETITTEDPNMKNNPSMQVLGVIKENEIEQNKLSDLEKPNAPTEQQLATLSKNPSDIYKHAYNMLIQENFSEAEKFFNIFIGENPKDPLASNAYYWLGETFYVQKQFQKASISFAKGYQQFPKGNKALDQLFKLALTFINLGKNEDACASFSKLDIEFPNAPKKIKSRIKDYKIRAKC